MAREAVLEKLGRFLEEKAFNEESQVLYLMVEIRKILEHEKFPSQYQILNFYCNWVVHSKLSKYPSQAMNEVLTKIAEQYSKHEVGAEDFRFLNFSHLKKDLRKFFEEKELPLTLIESPSIWDSFQYNLREILLDCPLQYEVPSIEYFSFVRPTAKRDIDWEVKLPGKEKFKGSMTIIEKQKD